MKRFDYVILGNSAAAVGAVESIRTIDPLGTLCVVSDENHHTYSRPRISDCITRRASAESIAYRPSNFYKAHSVTSLLGVRAVSLSTKESTVSLASGESIGYDRLLLSTGASPAKPPIPGISHACVHHFTTFDDADVLAREVPATEDIIVIGGGLIGLQAAEALSKVGVNVTVIEMLDRVLALAVDEYASSLIRSEFERHGVKIVTSTRVAEIGRNESSGVASVVLGDGREIPCQSVILAAGVTPRTELAALAGIKVNRGISVDDYMRTSAENVYAAGDVAETRELLSGEHRLIPIWPNAYMEGRIAGLSMAGRSVPYQGGLTMNAAHFFDFPVISSGVSQAGEGYDNSIQVNEHTGYYRRIILKKNVPVGMVMAGDAVDRSGLILSLIRNQTDCTSFLPELADTGFNTAHLPQDLRRIKQLGKERI